MLKFFTGLIKIYLLAIAFVVFVMLWFWGYCQFHNAISFGTDYDPDAVIISTLLFLLFVERLTTKTFFKRWWK